MEQSNKKDHEKKKMTRKKNIFAVVIKKKRHFLLIKLAIYSNKGPFSSQDPCWPAGFSSDCATKKPQTMSGTLPGAIMHAHLSCSPSLHSVADVQICGQNFNFVKIIQNVQK